MGVIHKNMSIRDQVREVDKVKKSESGMIHDPVTVHPDDNVGKVLSLMSEYRISGLPVVKGDKLVGIVTNRDVRFVTDPATRFPSHDQPQPHHRARGHQRRGGQAPPAPEPHRKAVVGTTRTS